MVSYVLRTQQTRLLAKAILAGMDAAKAQATGDPVENVEELIRLAGELEDAAARGRLCTIMSDVSDEDFDGDDEPSAIERALLDKDADWIAATRHRDQTDR